MTASEFLMVRLDTVVFALQLALSEPRKHFTARRSLRAMAGALAKTCNAAARLFRGSMRGHVFVTDSAWTIKTDEDGIARFDKVPEGAAQLRVWHPEQLVELPRRSLQVGATPVLETVPLSVVPRRRRL